VCRVELEDTSGRSRGEAFTVQCSDWCNVVALTPQRQVVMVWQYRFGTDALSLEIPGGVIDAGETPEQAARRELLEETGYRTESLEPLLIVEPNPAIQSNRCFTFLARDVLPTGTTCFDAQEELETALVPAERVEDLLAGGQVTHALVHSALEAFCRVHVEAVRGRERSTGWHDVDELLGQMQEQQQRKVLELARRLRPGLTLEDVQNPHDFPELDDRDWQYEDGRLSAIESVRTAVRAREHGGRRSR
jgi:8-oxo-dGTP pyrophosphatase MutT (NUDIX family)